MNGKLVSLIASGVIGLTGIPSIAYACHQTPAHQQEQKNHDNDHKQDKDTFKKDDEKKNQKHDDDKEKKTIHETEKSPEDNENFGTINKKHEEQERHEFVETNTPVENHEPERKIIEVVHTIIPVIKQPIIIKNIPPFIKPAPVHVETNVNQVNGSNTATQSQSNNNNNTNNISISNSNSINTTGTSSN